MPNVLLTTVCRPIGGPGYGPSVGVDVMKGQLCPTQSPFRTAGVGWAYGLEYLAANIDSPTVVLHWPSRRELIRELRRKRWDWVGLSFVLQLHAPMLDTVALIRQHAPGARIILGGYGTVVPGVERHADEVCRGEGISYLRELLGEQVGEPIRHPTITYGNRLLSLPVRAGRKVMVCTGLGCANGCDFCASSHKFRRRYVPLVGTGDELYSLLADLQRRTGLDEFQIFDENFLVDEARARQLADRCEAEGRHFEFFTFASVRSLARYSADELVRIGVSAVWVGLEGKQSTYDKLHGERLHELCARLRRHGILVCGSMIIGFDYQTPETIRQELLEILEAEPTYLQCLMYGPTPGTPLWERIEAEGRWLQGGPGQGIPWGQCDGFRLGFEHPHISAQQMAELQRECYRRDLEHGGHSIFRAIDTWLQGWRTLRDAPQAYLRARGRIYERKLRACRPLVSAGLRRAPSDRAHHRLLALRADLRRELGRRGVRERLAERLVLPAAARYTELADRFELLQQPRLIRRCYRC